MPTGDVYVLVGLPGVGKYTVAASLVRQLAAHNQVVRMVDNHYICNPVFGLVAEDGITRCHRQCGTVSARFGKW